MYLGELFLSGISSCAVNMVERLARTDSIVLEWMEVSFEPHRDGDADLSDFTLYDAIRIKFEMWGVEDEDALNLVEPWKKRWLLYGSIAVATPDTTVELSPIPQIANNRPSAPRRYARQYRPRLPRFLEP